MIVSVTAANIAACSHTTDCPVTRALERELPGHSVYVGPRYAMVDGAVCYLPEQVLAWCFEWDCGHGGEPFTFEFDPNKRPEVDIPGVYVKGRAT